MLQNPWNHSQLPCEKIYRRPIKAATTRLHEQSNFVNKYDLLWNIVADFEYFVCEF